MHLGIWGTHDCDLCNHPNAIGYYRPNLNYSIIHNYSKMDIWNEHYLADNCSNILLHDYLHQPHARKLTVRYWHTAAVCSGLYFVKQTIHTPNY